MDPAAPSTSAPPRKRPAEASNGDAAPVVDPSALEAAVARVFSEDGEVRELARRRAVSAKTVRAKAAALLGVEPAALGSQPLRHAMKYATSPPRAASSRPS